MPFNNVYFAFIRLKKGRKPLNWYINWIEEPENEYRNSIDIFRIAAESTVNWDSWGNYWYGTIDPIPIDGLYHCESIQYLSQYDIEVNWCIVFLSVYV
jgi:hypothetical protein